MKRLLVLLIAILLSIPLALGGIAGVSYYTTSEESVPRPSLSVMDVAVTPGGYTWRAPVFGGLIYRDFAQDVPPPASIGRLTQATLPLTAPPGYHSRATVYRAGETLWSGSAAELAGYQFLDNGRYSLLVECERAASGAGGSGVIRYHVGFTVRVQPRYETSDDWVAQGDVVAIRVFNLTGEQVPVAETDLGRVIFTPSVQGTMTGFVPVGHDCAAGSYPIALSVGGVSWEITVRVTESHFGPESAVTPPAVPGQEPTPAERPEINPALTRDYYNTIAPLLEESAPRQYWKGLFQQPVAGEVETDYGALRDTNQNREATSWAGIDIEAPQGAPVTAPNHGVVVFADELEAIGNTVVIDHGGGLMSLLYHMDELAVEAGDTVKTGQEIGAVGQTGRVSSPRLHYEVRLGQATVNPHLLFSGMSQLYYFAED